MKHKYYIFNRFSIKNLHSPKKSKWEKPLNDNQSQLVIKIPLLFKTNN